MACHHHGVMPFSMFINFGTEANHVGELFPDIDFRIAVMALVHTPILREILLSSGMISQPMWKTLMVED